MPSKTGVLVQARMGSTRLPGKVMALLKGRPVLEHVLERAIKIGPQVIVVTPCEERSQPIVDLAKDMGCEVFMGSEGDVLSRYARASSAFRLEIVMRITADCPKLDPEVCKLVLAKVPPADYSSNVLPRTYEKGLDCEAFTAELLATAHRKATSKPDREHVTPWMQRNANYIVNIEGHERGRRFTDWCIDTQEQLDAMNAAC